MSVSAIGSSIISQVQKLASASGSGPQPYSAASAQQEATESQATTVKEAQHGDPVAKAKLRQIQAQQSQQQELQAKPSEPGKGEHVDKTA